MLTKILIIVFFSLSISAYELPKLSLPKKNSPEIITFNVEGVVKQEQQLYKIKWKTINATNVNITVVGKVDSEGSVVISEEEYNRGPITLVASNENNTYVDEITLKKIIKDKRPPRKFGNKKGESPREGRGNRQKGPPSGSRGESSDKSNAFDDETTSY